VPFTCTPGFGRDGGRCLANVRRPSPLRGTERGGRASTNHGAAPARLMCAWTLAPGFEDGAPPPGTGHFLGGKS